MRLEVCLFPLGKPLIYYAHKGGYLFYIIQKHSKFKILFKTRQGKVSRGHNGAASVCCYVYLCMRIAY